MAERVLPKHRAGGRFPSLAQQRLVVRGGIGRRSDVLRLVKPRGGAQPEERVGETRGEGDSPHSHKYCMCLWVGIGLDS